MTVAAGTKLGPYEVLAPLGAGGMGPAGLSSFDPRPYDVAPDGRFLVVRAVGQGPSSPVVVDVHWTARPKP